MPFLMDPSIWVGLVTLIILEIILGVDNLIFITILANKLPTKKRNKAELIGLSLALTIRLTLLSVISWIAKLNRPIFSIVNFDFSSRDLIMLFGGIFLLFKSSAELHERIENHQRSKKYNKNYTNFWTVVLQIIVLDIIFSLDTIITAVGIVNYLPIMILAVVIAMIVILLTSKLLKRFINRHPTVIVLCLSLLLIVGIGLVAEGLGFHIPKKYLYTAISFCFIMKLFNQILHNNFDKKYQITKSPFVSNSIRKSMGKIYQINLQKEINNHTLILAIKEEFSRKNIIQ